MSSKWLLMSHFLTVPLLKIQLSFVTASLSLLVLVTLNELVRCVNFSLSFLYLSISLIASGILLIFSFLPPFFPVVQKCLLSRCVMFTRQSFSLWLILTKNISIDCFFHPFHSSKKHYVSRYCIHPFSFLL